MKIVENIEVYLKEAGVKPSYQRIRIFEFLLNNKIHPTVDEIYTALVKEIPTLSKTTVYNTLKLFVENKIVSLVNIEDNETRYDADTDFHGHFKCLQCKTIYDFDVNSDQVDAIGLTGFETHEFHVYIKGICKKCKN